MAVETVLVREDESGSEEHPHPIVGGVVVPEWTASCLVYTGWQGEHTFEERHFSWANLRVLRGLRRERAEQALEEQAEQARRTRRRQDREARLDRQRQVDFLVDLRDVETERDEDSPVEDRIEVETDIDLGDCNQQ